MMDTKLSILFYSKTSKQTKDGLTPIYLHVTINCKRFEQSTQRYVSLKVWSKEAGRAKGNSEEAKTVNYFLDSLRQKVYEYQRKIILDNEPFNLAVRYALANFAVTNLQNGEGFSAVPFRRDAWQEVKVSNKKQKLQ